MMMSLPSLQMMSVWLVGKVQSTALYLEAIGFGNDQLIECDSVLPLRHNCEEPICQEAVQVFKTEKFLM